MRFIVIIPARLQSSRLPRKVLLDIGGLPMIERVRRQAQASGAERVIVATDSEEVAATVRSYSGETMVTSDRHPTGSDRVAEVVETLQLSEETIIVNLQGDEPFAPPAMLGGLARSLHEGANLAQVATVATPITTWKEVFDPHVVKVVLAQNNTALYFSRSPIPWERDTFEHGAYPSGQPEKGMWWRHIGVYAYRAGFLLAYTKWPKAPMESLESLEQLRILERAHAILVARQAESLPPGVDTQEDLDIARELCLVLPR